jgi:hypothetical protein
MNPPVLYLDFDGVLNDDAWITSDARRAVWRYADAESAKHDIRPELAARVRRIVSATECRVVVCSTWRRLFTHDQLRACLDPHGIRFDGVTMRGKLSDGRLAAIVFHASKLPGGTRWCVLDDQVEAADVDGYGGHAVTPIDGVTDEDVERAIAALRGGA